MLYVLFFFPLLTLFTVVHCTNKRIKTKTKSSVNHEKSNSNQPKTFIVEETAVDLETDICSTDSESFISEKSTSAATPKEQESDKSKALISEEPYAAALFKDDISTTCSKCFATKQGIGRERIYLSPCSGCDRLYYCSDECEEADRSDHQDECRFFRSIPEDSIRLNEKYPSEDARLICRMITKSRRQPEWKAFNGRTYDSLMHHCELQEGYCKESEDVNNVYNEIREFMGSEAPDYDEFFLVYCKIIVNAFGIRVFVPELECRGTAMYLGLSIHDHSCRPDAYFLFQGSKLILRTTKMDCVYSDKLTISYRSNEIFATTEKRRKQLYNSYFFECKCEECEDDELNNKRMSGRPECCPDAWFSLDDLRCRKCNETVPTSLSEKVKAANALLEIKWIRGSCSEFTIKLNQLFQENKDIVSDYNVYLLDVIYRLAYLTEDVDAKIAFTEKLIPHFREISLAGTRAYYLCKSFFLLEKTKRKQKAKNSLDEAMESVKEAYGYDHDLISHFKQLKKCYVSHHLCDEWCLLY